MSGIATGTALAIGGIASAGGGLASSLIGSNAAGNAASTQAQSANYAANLDYQQAQQALGFNEQVYNNNQKQEGPYLQAGEGGLANLSYLLGIPLGGNGAAVPGAPTGTGAPGAPGSTSGANNALLNGVGDPSPILRGNSTQPQVNTPSGAPSAIAGTATTTPNVPSLSSLVNPALGAEGSLLQPWTGTFQSPTAAQAAAYPGEQFQQQQGEKAIQTSAAANGTLLSGGTEKALDQYSQGLASTDYQNVYNNMLNNYTLGYNQFENNQSNTYNRLASLAGLGQTSTAQLGSLNNQSAGQVSNTLLTSGQQIGQQVNNAGAARASGYVGQANALAGGIGGATSSLSNLGLLQSILGQGSAPSGIDSIFNSANYGGLGTVGAS